MASPGEFSPTKPSEGFYTCQDDLWSTHFLFPKVGEVSGQAFYLHLQNWGIGLPVLHGGYEQFLKLQALFWRKTTGVNELDHESPGPPNATQAHRWTDDQDLAEHLRHVTNALEGRGSGKIYQTKGDLIFVVHDDSEKYCSNLSCPGAGSKAAEKLESSLAITLEPLLDWGTVRPASDVRVASGRIFAFRRNGPRMNDPLWTQQVKMLVPKQPRTYCLGCLEELVNRQTEAQFIIDRSVGYPCEAGNHYFSVQPIQRPSSRSELYDLREGGEFVDNSSSEGLVSSTAGPLHLDGVADGTSYAKSHDYTSTKMNVHECSWTAEDDLFLVGDTVGGKGSSRSQRLSRSFTPPSGPSRVGSIHSQLSSSSSSHRPIPLNNSRPPTLGTSRTSTFVYRDPTSARQTLLKESVPDFGSSTHRFGREIDTNAVHRFFTNHRIRRENMSKAKDTNTRNSDIRNFFTPVNHQGPVTPKRAVKTKNVRYGESDLSDAVSDIGKEIGDSDAPDAEYTPVKNKGKARLNSVSPKNRTLSPKKKTSSPPSKHTGKAQPSHVPVYRKRDPATDNSPPFGVAQAAFEAHYQHTPSKSDLICSCRKPARTNEVLITQCVNKNCKVRWYHKDCLSTRGKLQARHGTYLCEQCQNEKHYTDLSRANGWTTKKLVQDEIGMPFTGQEMAGTLGNTGNFRAITNPYGLATTTATASATTLSPFAKPFTPGGMTATGAAALGRLAVGSEPCLGLETSRPYFVTKAYTRGGEHRRVADEEYENGQIHVYGCQSDEWDEKMDEG